MSNFPTPLSPWFVVQRIESDGSCSGDYKPPEFYMAEVEVIATGEPDQPQIEVTDRRETNFSSDPGKALIFMSLVSAVRVAKAEDAHVRVIASKDDLKEFKR